MMKEIEKQECQKIANDARKYILKMIHHAKSGHPGGSLSCIDILTYLYKNEIKLTKQNVNSNERNKFILSKGHGVPALYAILKHMDIIDEEEIWTFRKIDSRLQGHPNMNDTPGIDMSTGSLGQGISVAVGIALANQYKRKDYYTYVLCGDGEFEEGQVYEALMAAGHYKLNRFILLLDHNGLQIDGKIEDVINPQPFTAKLLAFGFDVFNIDGHDFNAIHNAIEGAKNSQKPVAIIAHTTKGKGVSFMENNVSWHGKSPNQEELQKALYELGG